MTEFIYGKAEFLGETDLVILTRSSLEEFRRFRECDTWADFAELLGKSWTELVEMRGGEIAQITGLAEPTPDAPFSFDKIWGHYVADLVPLPQQCGYDRLWEAVRRAGLQDTIRTDPILSNGLRWSGASPAGHISAVTATEGKVIERLAWFLKEAGVDDCTFVRDDEKIRNDHDTG